MKKIFPRLVKKIKFIREIKKKNIKIEKKVKITDFNKLNMAKNIYIGPKTFIMSKGTVTIGNNVIIGPKVTMWTENHNYNSITMLPYDELDYLKEVIIEDNVWIGLGVNICPGTTIGEGSIIGMGSVVRGNIPPLSIVIGNPAIIIGKRKKEVYENIVNNKGFYLKIKKDKNLKRKVCK